MAFTKDKKAVAVFADALGNPINYLRALELLDQLFLENSGLGQEWSVAVCGRSVEPVMLAGGVHVFCADHISRRDIAEISVAIMATSDQQVQTWCEESGVAIVTGMSRSSVSGALLGGRA